MIYNLTKTYCCDNCGKDFKNDVNNLIARTKDITYVVDGESRNYISQYVFFSKECLNNNFYITDINGKGNTTCKGFN